MEGEFQYKGQIDQYLEEWLSPRGSQYIHGFLSEEEKQESIQIEDSAMEGAIMRNQAPQGGPSTILVIKWSEKVEGFGDNIHSPLCSVLYKEEEDSLVTWSGTDPNAKMNFFAWSKENNDWIVPDDQYNEEFKNWRGPIHNGQFCSQTLKEKRKTKETCSKYTGSAKFNEIPREGNPTIPIKYYKDQCRENMIRNAMWNVFSLPDPLNKEKRRDILLHKSRFPLEYVKRHIQSLKKGSETDQYVAQNLMCSGV